MPTNDAPRSIPAGVARGRARAPGSKSHAQRLLIAGALAHGTTHITGLPDSDDVSAVVGALRALGISIEGDGDAVRVEGACGSLPVGAATLDLGGSGTGWRFLGAVCALGPGPYTLTGDASLLGRPFGSLGPALRGLGLQVTGGGGDGSPPVVAGGPVGGGGELVVDGSRSSHPLSALLLLGPHLQGGLRLRVAGQLVSRPYVEFTLDVLRAFGVDVDEPRPGCFEVASTRLSGLSAEVEGDWSSGAYLLAAAAATGGDVWVDGLRADSVQADRRIVEILERFGANVSWEDGRVHVRGHARRGVDVDLADSPDLAPLVAALACVAEGATTVRGAPHLRIKESDRIATSVAAARALGCTAVEHADGFTVEGRGGGAGAAQGGARGGAVDPAGDHRLAMAFAVAGLACGGTSIGSPGCVAKSYPSFWDDLSRLTSGT